MVSFQPKKRKLRSSEGRAGRYHFGIPPVESEMGLINEVLLEHLFMEIVFHTLDNSLQEDSTEPDQEMAFYKIERIGFNIGQRIIEMYQSFLIGTVFHTVRLLHKNLNTRITDQLEAFKFICKEFWTFVFKRQVDNLKTNHRGVYVMQVQDFPWSSRFAADSMAPDNAKLTILV